MKRLVGLSFLFLMVTATANANVPRDRLQLFEFNFTCNFQPGGAITDRQPPGPQGCTAYATVFAYVDTDDWMSMMHGPRQNLINKIAVKCGDELVAADSAILQNEKRFVAITGISGTPKLLVKRRHHESVTTMSDDYEAFLFLDDHKLRGECEVVNRPVFGPRPVQ